MVLFDLKCGFVLVTKERNIQEKHVSNMNKINNIDSNKQKKRRREERNKQVGGVGGGLTRYQKKSDEIDCYSSLCLLL